MHWFNPQACILPLTLAPDLTVPLRVVQITDCHLFADEQLDFCGINPAAYLTRTLEYLATQPFDLLLVTGDVTQDHSDQSYQLLAQQIKKWLPTTTVAWLPGNHDEIDALERYLSGVPFSSDKHLQLGDWHILLLNSKGPTPAGLISDQHFEQLVTVLNDIDEHHRVALFCHHQPLPVNGYIDKHKLSNGQQLIDLLRQYPQVKCLAHGHVHQQRETFIDSVDGGGFYLWATPSTSIQFVINTVKRAEVDLGPAFRYFDLYANGRVESQVVWLNELNELQ